MPTIILRNRLGSYRATSLTEFARYDSAQSGRIVATPSQFVATIAYPTGWLARWDDVSPYAPAFRTPSFFGAMNQQYHAWLAQFDKAYIGYNAAFNANFAGPFLLAALYDIVEIEKISALRFEQLVRGYTAGWFTNRWDATQIADYVAQVVARFDCPLVEAFLLPNSFALRNVTPLFRLPFIEDFLITQRFRESVRLDAYNGLGERFTLTPFHWKIQRAYDTLMPNQFGPGFRFFTNRLPSAFDVIKPLHLWHTHRFDSLVKDGWRIMARNLVTDETQSLGFIESPQRELAEIKLHDGDY